MAVAIVDLSTGNVVNAIVADPASYAPPSGYAAVTLPAGVYFCDGLQWNMDTGFSFPQTLELTCFDNESVVPTHTVST